MKEKMGRIWGKGIYKLRLSEILLLFSKAFLLQLALAYIFYRSIWGLIPGAFAALYFFCQEAGNINRKKKHLVLEQFKSTLGAMQGSLEAGNSMERSLKSARLSLIEMYGEDIEMAKALGGLEKKLDVNIPLDTALSEMAELLDIREVYDFVEVITISMRTGGNTVRLIGDTAGRIVESIELEAELEVIVAAKKLEQKVMTFMPALIILFLKLTSDSFLDPLYKTGVGSLLMTMVVAGNVLADYLGRRIVDVK